MKGRRIRDFDRWHGPGVIIGDEPNPLGNGRRGYWVSHNGQLMLVAPEHVRLATRVEQLLPGIVAHLLKDVAEELRAPGGTENYEDLTALD